MFNRIFDDYNIQVEYCIKLVGFIFHILVAFRVRCSFLLDRMQLFYSHRNWIVAEKFEDNIW